MHHNLDESSLIQIKLFGIRRYGLDSIPPASHPAGTRRDDKDLGGLDTTPPQGPPRVKCPDAYEEALGWGAR